MKNSQGSSETLHSVSSESMIAPRPETRDCFGCYVTPNIDYVPTGEFILVCPLCGCSINPQNNLGRAIAAWNSKQRYLEAEVWREYER